MNIILIAAMDKNRAIGKEGGIPWHFPKDFAWFKQQTLGFPVLMGRKCYEDIVKYTKGKPLPGRKNIVLTTQNLNVPGFEFHNNIESAIYNYDDKNGYTDKYDTLFVIGGSNLYNEFINHHQTNKIILTRIDMQVENADTFFPEFDTNIFKKVSTTPEIDKGIQLSFEIYEKNV